MMIVFSSASLKAACDVKALRFNFPGEILHE